MQKLFKKVFFEIRSNLLDREIQSAPCRGDFENFQPFGLKPSRNGDMAIFTFLRLYEHFTRKF